MLLSIFYLFYILLKNRMKKFLVLKINENKILIKRDKGGGV